MRANYKRIYLLPNLLHGEVSRQQFHIDGPFRRSRSRGPELHGLAGYRAEGVECRGLNN